MKKILKVSLIIFTTALSACQSSLSSSGSVSSSSSSIPEIADVSIYFDAKVADVEVATLTGKPGTSVTSPEIPIKEGYVFSYWSLDNAPYTFTVFPDHSIILEAVWKQFYNLMYDTDSEQIFETLKILEGEEISLPPLGYKLDNDGNAYQFAGWYYQNELVNFSFMPNQDVLLTAKWAKSNAIIFDVGNSLTSIEPLFETTGQEISAPQVEPVLNGYIFTGWTLNNLPYIFNQMPAQTITLKAKYVLENEEYNQVSSLPKIFINLDNNLPLGEVVREQYVNSSVTIKGVEAKDNLTAVGAEFKGRGHGSWVDSGTKRGYRIKFFKKQAPFGEAKSKHWVLLAGANFYDPTLAKNATVFKLANQVFNYIEYASSTHWVELYVNHEFRGVYLFAEHIRVDKGRVDISSKFGINDTGYLIEYDAYATEDGPEGIFYFQVSGLKYPFAIKSPDPEDYLDEGITEVAYRDQINFIKNYTTTVMQAALNKNWPVFSEYADVNSFVDMYLLHELFKNTDTGWSSLYMAKKPGGKLYMTAPWDFDASAGSNRGDTSPNGLYVSSYEALKAGASLHTSSELYIALMQIPEFQVIVRNRWSEISSQIKSAVNAFLSDEFIAENKFGFGRNYKMWSREYPPLNLSQSQAETNWENSVITLRNWLLNRSIWFDNNL